MRGLNPGSWGAAAARHTQHMLRADSCSAWFVGKHSRARLSSRCWDGARGAGFRASSCWACGMQASGEAPARRKEVVWEPKRPKKLER